MIVMIVIMAPVRPVFFSILRPVFRFLLELDFD